MAVDWSFPGYTDASRALDIRVQGLATIDQACAFLGGMSRDTFDRHVRRHVKTKPINGRPYYLVSSLIEFTESDAYRSLS